MMSVLHNGLIRTMKAAYRVDDKLSVIRPLVYVRESSCDLYAKQADLPVINENCPACFEEPKERARIKKLLSKEENLNSTVFESMRKCLVPVMHPNVEEIFQLIGDQVIEGEKRKGRDERGGGEEEGVGEGELATAKAKLICDFTDNELMLEMARRRSRHHQAKASWSEQSSAPGLER